MFPRMSLRHTAPFLLLWALVTSRDPELPLSAWKQVALFDSDYLCKQARDASVDQAVMKEIGALAHTDVYNPMRVAAYTKANRKLDARFRCVSR